jgi:hypothetical protein
LKRFLVGSILGSVLGAALAGGLVWRSRSHVIQLRTVQGTVTLVGTDTIGLLGSGGYTFYPGTHGIQYLHKGAHVKLLIEHYDDFPELVLSITRAPIGP